MACCDECAQAQAQGLMELGATCSPCASGNCPKPACRPGYALVQTQDGGFRCVPQATILESDCPSLMLARIDAVATAQWEAQNDDLEGIALLVLEAVYPQTPDGRRIDWRNLTIDTAICLLELRRRVKARIAYVLAHHDEELAEKRWRALRGGQ